MGPVDFVASLGGLFGLCLGFSIISFFEIIYWVATGVFKLGQRFFFFKTTRLLTVFVTAN